MKQPARWLASYWGIVLVALMVCGWVIIVWKSGQGWNPSGIAWDFDNTAKLADSFGVLSAAMAAIAAFYAFLTYKSARADSARLERQAAEPSYLNLLERRYDVLDRVRLQTQHFEMNANEGLRVVTVETLGQAAVDSIASGLREQKVGDPKPTAERFKSATKDVFGLPNLFRFTYHIIAFADRQFSTASAVKPMTGNDPAYQYVRLLRAQMSDSELLLIALNCAYAEGEEKFKPLIQRYAFLHNMRPDDIEAFALRDLFEPGAFGVEGAAAERVPAVIHP